MVFVSTSGAQRLRRFCVLQQAVDLGDEDAAEVLRGRYKPDQVAADLIDGGLQQALPMTLLSYTFSCLSENWPPPNRS